jgi:F-type H+-transporting ATPase subunit beta
VRLLDFATADVVIHLAREVAKAKIYPAVDLRTSHSRLIATGAVGEEHRVVAEQVRRVLAAALWNAGDPPEAAADRLMVERARKLQNYFTQPFFVAEPYTHRPGTHVSLDEALRTCRDLGRPTRRHPVKAFYFAGGIEEIRNRAAAAQ